MTEDQTSVAIGAASGIIVMILLLLILFVVLPDPGAFDTPSRIAYALKWDAVAAFPLFVMLASIGNARFSSEAIDPTLGKESPTMEIDARVAGNKSRNLLWSSWSGGEPAPVISARKPPLGERKRAEITW